MPDLTAGNALKALKRFKISVTLKFDGADKVSDQAGIQPKIHQLQQFIGVANDVRKKPVNRAHVLRCQGEGVFFKDFHFGVVLQFPNQGSLVHTEDLTTQIGENPGPSA